jgi:hypothetical protein
MTRRGRSDGALSSAPRNLGCSSSCRRRGEATRYQSMETIMSTPLTTACCDDIIRTSELHTALPSWCPPAFVTLSVSDWNPGICAVHLRGAREDCPRPAASMCLDPPSLPHPFHHALNPHPLEIIWQMSLLRCSIPLPPGHPLPWHDFDAHPATERTPTRADKLTR